MFAQENVELYLMLYALLLTSHFICEFVLVWPYQYENGHIYKHPGNIIHSATHALCMLTVLGFILGYTNFVLMLVVIVSIVHYQLTWLTLNSIKAARASPRMRRLFDAQWWIIGFDQWAHHMMYWVMLYTMHKRDAIAAYFMCTCWPPYINQLGLLFLS